MAALTLLEASKLNNYTEFQSAVVEIYSGSSDVLRVLPFQDIAGNSYSYNQETTLPGIGFRGYNEAYTAAFGILNPVTERLVIAGGEVDVDKAIDKTMPGNREVQEEMQIRALGLAWTRKFIKGDQTSDPREFDGLQTRITGDQLLSAGTTSGGAALSLAKLDELIDQCMNCTHLLMSKALARRFSAAARSSSVGGYITFDKNEFGRRVMAYDGKEILTVDLDNTETAILPYTEAAYTGGSTATSIYALSIGPGMVTGLQHESGMEVSDLGELESKPAYRTRIEWMSGIMIQHGRAAARLRHIGDLAIVA